MILHLNDGTERSARVGGPTMGLAVKSITLDYSDMRTLYAMKDKQTYLATLLTRFVPERVDPNKWAFDRGLESS